MAEQANVLVVKVLADGTEVTFPLDLSVDAEGLPQYLEVRGIRYMRFDRAPDRESRELAAVREYFGALDTSHDDVYRLLDMWVTLQPRG